MTDNDIAQALIEAALNAGADQADALVSDAKSVYIGTADKALEEVERAESHEAGLRVIVGQGQASIASSDLSPAALQEIASRAVAIAKATPDDPYSGLADRDQVGGWPDPAGLELADQSDPLEPAALEALARRAEDAAMSVKGVSQVEQSHAGQESSQITMLASNGFEGSYAKTSFSVGASAIAGEGLGRERDYSGESRRHFADLPSPEEIGARAGERATRRLGPRKPPGGAVPVLYDRRCSASLIGHLLGAVNGAAIARGSSWLGDAMDQVVLPQGIDLIEDPLRVRGAASRPFDAEGIAAKVRPIVLDGRLMRWVLDCASARKLGLQTTGNARRGLAGPPSPGTTNTADQPWSISRSCLMPRK